MLMQLLALHYPAASLMEWAEDARPGRLAGDNQDGMCLGPKYLRIQWASQGTNSAIAALEAGECIDTTDEGLGTSSAAISPLCILSVNVINITIDSESKPKLSPLGAGSHRE